METVELHVRGFVHLDACHRALVVVPMPVQQAADLRVQQRAGLHVLGVVAQLVLTLVAVLGARVHVVRLAQRCAAVLGARVRAERPVLMRVVAAATVHVRLFVRRSAAEFALVPVVRTVRMLAVVPVVVVALLAVGGLVRVIHIQCVLFARTVGWGADRAAPVPVELRVWGLADQGDAWVLALKYVVVHVHRSVIAHVQMVVLGVVALRAEGGVRLPVGVRVLQRVLAHVREAVVHPALVCVLGRALHRVVIHVVPHVLTTVRGRVLETVQRRVVVGAGVRCVQPHAAFHVQQRAEQPAVGVLQRVREVVLQHARRIVQTQRHME